jgi:MYXO-CTERM domain-containing protein
MSALRWVKLASLVSAIGVLGVACSAGEASDPNEPLGTSGAAITGACSEKTIGQPCAPFGSSSECDGVCTVGPGFGGGVNVTCQRTTASNNIGKVCNSAAATSCSSYCGDLGGGAVGCITGAGISAPDGAACTPPGGATACDGQCTAGTCVALAARCGTYGQNASGCGYQFCNPKNATACVTYPLATTVPRGCNDGNACTTNDRCDGTTGLCNGTAVTCAAPTNPCLDPGTCNTGTGKCDYNANTKACTLTADKCHAGLCAGGSCTTGAAVSCDDGNACTVDSCDAATGCQHAAKCVPTNKCFTASCDATSGSCTQTALPIDDANPCTTDACDPTVGVTHTAIPGCTFTPPDAGVDTGVVDTGVPPTDTGVVDTGVKDTGVPPTDTGVPPTDTGVVDSGVKDTGVPPTDTGVPPLDTGVVVDTGTTVDTGLPGMDGDVIDSDVPADTGGADGAVDDAPQLSSGGCSCETPNGGTGAGSFAWGGLGVGLAIFAGARRRRR